MSITTAGSQEPIVEQEADFYDDLIVERYNYQAILDAATTGNGTFNTGQLLDESPAGNLEGHQVAELVAMGVAASVWVEQSGSAGTTPGNVRWDFNVHLIEQGHTPFNGEDVNEFDRDPDDDGTDEFGSDSSYRKNPTGFAEAVLFDRVFHTYQAFNDTTNGTGGLGSPYTQEDWYRNYRREYGRGPIAFPDWVIGMNGALQKQEIDNEDVHVKAHVRTVWDVFEVAERRSYRDIFES